MNAPPGAVLPAQRVRDQGPEVPFMRPMGGNGHGARVDVGTPPDVIGPVFPWTVWIQRPRDFRAFDRIQVVSLAPFRVQM